MLPTELIMVVLVVTDTIPCMVIAADSVDIVYIDMHTGVHDTSVCLSDSMNLHAYTTVYGKVDNVGYLWTPSGNIGESNDSVANFFGIGNFTYMVTATTYPLGALHLTQKPLFLMLPLLLPAYSKSNNSSGNQHQS